MGAGWTSSGRDLYFARAMIYTSSVMRRVALAIFLAFPLACVQRQMSIQSDPPGALVYLNGEEVGRTPLQRDFTWYGTYDVVLRQDGYETLKTRARVIAPIWQWPPFDLLAEFFPLTDRHDLHFTMTPAGDTAIDLDAILERSSALKSQLQGSRVQTTRPTSQ
jgi:hypothetical protein